MTDWMKNMTFEQLQNFFAELGIDTTLPGFYDDPNFIAHERNDPDFLSLYGDFVRQLPLTSEQEKTSRSEIEAVTRFVYERIRASGRPGACIDASGLIHRMLEKRGVWSYVLKGAVTITYRNEGASISPGHFRPISFTPNTMTGHCWVSAPPYRVADATIQLQLYMMGQAAFIPDVVLEDGPLFGAVEAADLVDPDEWFSRTRRPLSLELLANQNPSLISNPGRFGVVTSEHPNCVIKYIPTGMSVPDLPLESMCDGIKCGSLPLEIYNQYISTREK